MVFLSSAEFLSLLQHIHQTANQVMTSWSLQAQHSFTTKTNRASLFVRFVLMILIYSYIFLYILIYSYIFLYILIYSYIFLYILIILMYTVLRSDVLSNHNNLITVVHTSSSLFSYLSCLFLLCLSHSVILSQSQGTKLEDQSAVSSI